MKIKELKEVEGIFKPSKKKYYFGKVRHGTPYFYPYYFEKYILHIRKLIPQSQEKIDAYNKQYPHLKGTKGSLFTNLPMVRRNKNLYIKLFGNEYFVSYGWPIKIHKTRLGWKDKYDSPRFEWSPAFHIFFFGLQFCIWWGAPDNMDTDKYYEQILWYLYYADEDIKKAKETWPWQDYKTKESTWNDKYLII